MTDINDKSNELVSEKMSLINYVGNHLKAKCDFKLDGHEDYTYRVKNQTFICIGINASIDSKNRVKEYRATLVKNEHETNEISVSYKELIRCFSKTRVRF